MKRAEVSTTIYLPPEEVYEFLVEFPEYAAYSKHLRSVRRVDEGPAEDGAEQSGTETGRNGSDVNDARRDANGAGGAATVGAEYALRFQWWKLGYTARSRVVDLDPPTTIEWELTRDIDARGRWIVRGVDPPAGGPDVDAASEVTLEIDYDPGSVGRDVIDLPRLVSFSWVIDRVQDLVVAEGERVVERIVADLEGEPRDVELRVTVENRTV